jgi:hypothetical protein
MYQLSPSGLKHLPEVLSIVTLGEMAKSARAVSG